MKQFNSSKKCMVALRALAWAGLVCAIAVVETGTSKAADSAAGVPKWGRFEKAFESSANYENPTQQGLLGALFKSPSGESYKVYGFWDGERTWRVRFSPNQTGKWTYTTACNDTSNAGLHGQKGEFECIAPAGTSRFQQHGPIRVSPDLRYLVHDDGTPFFWIADTAWNGPLLSKADEWEHYVQERTRQKFTAVQFVATQWRAAPDGDANKQRAYTGTDKISINPAFFQRLDEKIDAMNKAGLLAAPVMLWAIQSGADPKINPGVSLSEEQAALLARYMVGRWGANQVAWILAGDGDYRGGAAERWKRIGRAVFGDVAHAPVMLHPGGMLWPWNEFKDVSWLGIFGYQSGHNDDDNTLRWLIEGPLTDDWGKMPHRPFINLEPPYEGHLAYASKKPITADTVRRAIYWSLLNAPTTGVSYGGHGVWGWDDGTKPPTDHAGSGTPKPWREALKLPAAEQMKHLSDFFNSIDWWRLAPASMFVVGQPGKESPRRFIAAGRSVNKELLVIYVPEDRTVEVKLDSLPPSPQVTWFNPRTGEKSPAVGVVTTSTCQFPSPSEGDWILYMFTQKDTAKDKPKEGGEKKEDGGKK